MSEATAQTGLSDDAASGLAYLTIISLVVALQAAGIGPLAEMQAGV
jgi:hypothetical protein